LSGFGWQPLPNPPRGEDDVFELWVLRDLARDLDAKEMLQAELVARVHAAVVDEGWHDRATGRPPDPEAVRRQLAEPLRLLGVLGLSREGGDWGLAWWR
jgi:hypothetical protein